MKFLIIPKLLTTWSASLSKRKFLISIVAFTVFLLLVVFVVGSLGEPDLVKERLDYLEQSLANVRKENRVLGVAVSAKEGEKYKRKKIFEEISPNGERRIVLYENPFVGEGDLDYRNYLTNQYVFTVESYTDGHENDIFINDYRTGYPHWLGNDYVFFTSGCGSGCRGLYLVNANSKESWQALLVTDPFSDGGSESTFQDWFDQEFKFSGWVDHIRGAFVNGKVYLIFQMRNHDKPFGEKRFLFSGKSLEAL